MINNEETIIIEDVLDSIRLFQSVVFGICTGRADLINLNRKNMSFNTVPSEIDDHLTYGKIY